MGAATNHSQVIKKTTSSKTNGAGKFNKNGEYTRHNKFVKNNNATS